MVLKTAFSVNQSGAAYGNPAQDFDVKTHIEEDTTLQGQVGRVITATFDLGNSIPERAERIATFLLDRTTKLVRQTGYRLLLGQASALDHLAGDVLTSPDDVSFDPANTRDFEALEVTVQPDGSVEVAGQEYQDIFSDAASAAPAQETALPPRPLAGVVGGFQIGAVFVPDQLNGASNPGEIDFDPLPNQDHTLWRLPDGTRFTFPAGSQFVSQAAQETYSGRVYVIFSKQKVNSERGLAAFQDSHILVLRWNNGTWQYDNNTTWVAFTPQASDICLFEVQRGGGTWAADPARWIGQELISHVTPREKVVNLNDAGDALDAMRLASRAVALQVLMQQLTNSGNAAAAMKIGGDAGSRADETDTGATRGRNALDSLNKLTTGTALQTVAQLGDAHDRAVGAIDATNIVVAGGVDFARAYANKNLGNIADAAGRFAAVEAGANKTETRTAAAIAGQGALATKSAVDMATAEVLNKTALNIAETGARKWLPTLNRIFSTDAKRTGVEGLENNGNLKAARFNSANVGKKVLADNLYTRSKTNPATGWSSFTNPPSIDIAAETASITLEMVLPSEGGSGSRRIDTVVANIGFSITSGAGPATPQVSRQGNGSLTQNSPVIGDGLTLTMYVRFTTGTFSIFSNAKINQDTTVPLAAGKVT